MEFSVAQQEYIRGLKEELKEQDHVSVANFERILSLTADQIKLEVEKSLSRLNELKVSENHASKKTRLAWVILRNFFEKNASAFESEDILPVMYGSIIFDDPRNLDFDILLVTERHGDEIEKMIDPWREVLNREWKKVGSEGHISHLPMDRLRMHCEAFQKGWKENSFYVDMDFGQAAIVMSGEPINGKIEEYREQVWKLASETPVLMGALAMNLGETVIEREIRRAGLRD